MPCSEYISDEDYVRDLRQGGRAYDRAAECLYRKYRDTALVKIKSYLKYRDGIEEDALDVLQDAFFVMTEKICGDGYNEGSLVHFWIGITRGLLRNKLKRDARVDLIDQDSQYDSVDDSTPESLLLSEEQRAVLDAVLNQLGGKCKEVLMMWAGGYSMEEIALAVGLSSEAMARKTKYKCKNQLMDLLDHAKIDL